MASRIPFLCSAMYLVSLVACTAEGSDVAADEAAQTSFRLPAEGSCEGQAMRSVANEASLEELDGAAGLSRTAAENVIAARPIPTLAALDGVPQIGPAALASIFEHAKATGKLAACATPPPAGGNPDEIGIISDLDDTVIPASTPDMAKAPFPGVKALYSLLERQRASAKDGDVYFVTARKPERVVEVPAYLAQHGVPGGPIETGVSGIPAVAAGEKVRDINGILDRTGSQRFVMFGDSSHVDPEAYKKVVAARGDRIAVALIHLEGGNQESARFAGLRTHHSYAEAAAILFELGVLTRAEANGVMKAAQSEGLAITDAAIADLLATHAPKN